MKIQGLILLVGLILLFIEAKAQTGCGASTAQTDLDINNVSARIFPGADMWWDLVSAPKYEVPNGSGSNRLFAGSLWIGGVDAGGQAMVAAQMFRATPSTTNATDFFTGPGDSCSASYCNQFDRIWKINKQEVINFIAGQPATTDMIQYPGNYLNGNVFAPFVDMNSDGIYNSADGDYPAFDITGSIPDSVDQLYGDQCLWYAFNDVCSTKTQTNSPSMGLEIQGKAFAFASSDPAINNTTFYQYRIINHSAYTLNNVYLGFWSGTPLFTDVRRGCHVIKNMAYVTDNYSFDPPSNSYPSAIGISLLQGPLADVGDGIDNDRDSIIDEPGERCSMSSYIVFENVNGQPMGNPDSTIDYLNYLQGLNDSVCPCTSLPSPYMYPGVSDPGCPCNWIENSPAGDYFFIMSTGQITFQPGDIQTINYAVTWAVDSIAGYSLDSLFAAHDVVENFFRAGFNNSTVSVNEIKKDFKATVYPNPFIDQTLIRFDNSTDETLTFALYDAFGKQIRIIEKIRGNQIILEGKNLNSGIYFYTVKNDSGKSFEGKLIVN